MAKPNGENISAARREAFERLKIPITSRAILCLDGGGIRGILTIQLLKKLEEVAGMPCYQLFDMVAGTSTGAIIAGLITSGHSAAGIEDLYEKLVTKVFEKRFLKGRFFNLPAYTKNNYRTILKGIIGDVTLEEACARHNLDLMITASDISAGEETFFSCFKQEDGSYYGTYKTVLLRAAMEATMSAPTYFYPMERFLDGGTTTYNNPSLAAFIEATSYSTPKGRTPSYSFSEISLFSFGTGMSRQFKNHKEIIRPKGLAITFWLHWIMNQTGQDASMMQVNTFRSPVFKKILDMRRFEISLDHLSLKQLEDTDTLDTRKYGTASLHQLSTTMLNNVDLADTRKFDLMKIIGQQMAKYIVSTGNNFQTDLVNEYGDDALVSYFGDVECIKRQMSDAAWLDKSLA
ncbi:MAG: patatin-like phospholipase family protein [Ginsengibacter sp.]